MEPLWSWVCRKRPSGFGACSTAEEVTEGIDASNITTIVTGATSGIGIETARVLALRGATVIIAARSKVRGEKAKEKIVEEVADAKIEVTELDLSSLASVRSFAAAFLSSNKPLHLLINNAGILGCPFQFSADGIELQFATNYIGGRSKGDGQLSASGSHTDKHSPVLHQKYRFSRTSHLYNLSLLEDYPAGGSNNLLSGSAPEYERRFRQVFQ